MKKRTTVSAVASFLLAGVMCVGFAACGEETAESVEGEEVTKEVFDAALDFSSDSFKNVKLDAESMNTQEGDDYLITATANGIVVLDGDKEYSAIQGTVTTDGNVPAGMTLSGDIDIECYYDYSNNEAFVKSSLTGGKWSAICGSSMRSSDGSVDVPPSQGMDMTMTAKTLFQLVKGAKYEESEYSEDLKGYVWKNESMGITVVIKIKEEKLKAFSYELKQESSYSKNHVKESIVFTYGGQSVTRPDVG